MKRIRMVSLCLARERTIPYQTRELDSSRTIYDLFRGMAEDVDREAMWVACLDVRNYVTCRVKGAPWDGPLACLGRGGENRQAGRLSYPGARQPKGWTPNRSSEQGGAVRGDTPPACLGWGGDAEVGDCGAGLDRFFLPRISPRCAICGMRSTRAAA